MIREGGLFGPAVDDGEWYRIVTSAFLHAGLFHLLLNMFALYILGSLLEPGIGTARFLGVYVVSMLGGSFGALLLDPTEVTVGASGGIFGLMAATFIVARGRGMDELASQIGLFVVINLVFTFSIPGISIGGHLGGLLAGRPRGARDHGAGAPRRSSGRSASSSLRLASLGAGAMVGAVLAAGSATGLG